jgi:hypothetical protein
MLRYLASDAGVVGNRMPIVSYWSIGPVSYQRTATGALRPLQVHNPLSAWQASGVSNGRVPGEPG